MILYTALKGLSTCKKESPLITKCKFFFTFAEIAYIIIAVDFRNGGEKMKDKAYIGVLDGFRTFAILSLMFFHFWQQSWLGGFKLNLFNNTFEIMPREFFCSGAAWVDLLLLLTAFLMFLPFARLMNGENISVDKPLRFYRKRIARLVPSAYFHIAILVIFIIRVSDYNGVGAYIKDLVRNLLFMQNSPYPEYVYTKYTGTLWTLSVEMLFYLVFPLLARVFKKAPALTFTSMICASEAYINLYAIPQINSGYTLPHRLFPSYLGVFAFGMMTSLIYVRTEKSDIRNKRYFVWLCTLIGIVASICGIALIWYGYGRNNNQLWQVENRLLFAGITSIAILAVSFSAKGLKMIYSNPFTHFIATISYNLYIWHQFFSIYLKKWHIPPYPDAPRGSKLASVWPQGGDFAGHTAWQWQYTLILWAVTFAVATLVTYFIEKPCAKLILGGKKHDKTDKR